MRWCFRHNYFDAIFCCEAIMLFEKPMEALASWHDYLKNGGMLSFTSTYEESYFGRLLKDAIHSVLGSRTPSHMHEPLGSEQKHQRRFICDWICKSYGSDRREVDASDH